MRSCIYSRPLSSAPLWPFLFVSQLFYSAALEVRLKRHSFFKQITFSCGSVLGARRYGEVESVTAIIKVSAILLICKNSKRLCSASIALTRYGCLGSVDSVDGYHLRFHAFHPGHKPAWCKDVHPDNPFKHVCKTVTHVILIRPGRRTPSNIGTRLSNNILVYLATLDSSLDSSRSSCKPPFVLFPFLRLAPARLGGIHPDWRTSR